MAETICEGGRFDISCPDGKTIDVVEASYGRHDRETCFSSTAKDFDCHYVHSLASVRHLCQGKPSCRSSVTNGIIVGFNGNPKLDDPCYGTRKYLQLTYYCH
ncbi:hypothetical protein OS493_003471 [Desmophyllum pertusum]|uniref:SUEL-type lectin domain-containing protein n=1 Tax=Desmophyllum pertusum TaxID=174260 RepID=A0A9X0DAX0_9CNID|nr:hypothetical protein OS493_003471 [Desmophyllum pertusum]